VQWEGVEINYDIERDFRADFNISYDATNTRVRVYAFEAVGNRAAKIETIALFASKTFYEIDHNANTCHKGVLNTPFEPDCLPQNSTREVGATIGITLPVYIYRIAFSEGNNFVRGQAVLTQTNNVPVGVVTFSQRDGIDHSDYFDITAGIKNPAIFTPPSICNQASSIASAPSTSPLAQAVRARIAKASLRF